MHPKGAYWMANSVDPDQIAPSEAVWSGSTLFVQICLSENLGSLRYYNSNTDSWNSQNLSWREWTKSHEHQAKTAAWSVSTSMQSLLSARRRFWSLATFIIRDTAKTRISLSRRPGWSAYMYLLGSHFVGFVVLRLISLMQNIWVLVCPRPKN